MQMISEGVKFSKILGFVETFCIRHQIIHEWIPFLFKIMDKKMQGDACLAELGRHFLEPACAHWQLHSEDKNSGRVLMCLLEGQACRL